jgi:prevent-host-death family protein
MSISVWALQDAKAHFSLLVDQACTKGPQHVTRRGRPAVVVVAEADYSQLVAGSGSLVDFFRQSPLAEVELEVQRDLDTGRGVEL